MEGLSLFFFLRAHKNHTGPLRLTLNESKYVTIKQIGRAFLCDIIDPKPADQNNLKQ